LCGGWCCPPGREAIPPADWALSQVLSATSLSRSFGLVLQPWPSWGLGVFQSARVSLVTLLAWSQPACRSATPRHSLHSCHDFGEETTTPLVDFLCPLQGVSQRFPRHVSARLGFSSETKPCKVLHSSPPERLLLFSAFSALDSCRDRLTPLAEARLINQSQRVRVAKP
jgi:hypothetical protein